MKHPALIMRGTPTGQYYFYITNSKGETELSSRSFETEEECKDMAERVSHLVKNAADNQHNQLPSEIAHK